MSDKKDETELTIGPGAVHAYSRLSYTMWHALAEFIDNSTQSRLNYGSIIEDVLKAEGAPLVVEVTHNRPQKELRIEDNSIGMTREDLVAALRIAQPTKDSKGRSKYGLGMKTAACWIGRHWKVITTEWGSGEEWTAEIDVDAVAQGQAKIPLTMTKLKDTNAHYTKIVISGLRRNIQKRTEETIRSYLGSIYRHDIEEGRLKLTYNGDVVPAPDDSALDMDPEGKIMRRDLEEIEINGKKVRGWVGVLKKGGRKFGGFSLFQNRRQIQGFPQAWKPKSIFGGVDDEGANNLVAQRLMGMIDLDGFEVSHTKDAILFQEDEEAELEKFLYEQTKDFRDYAQKRRGSKGQSNWSREKIRDLLEGSKDEFSSDELKDAINTTMLPPIDTILANNKKQVEKLEETETVATYDVLPDLRLVISFTEKSEHEPHLTIVTGAEAGTLHLIINGLHPYYSSLDAQEAIDECLKQYIYDAIAEYRVSKMVGQVNPDSVRRLKHTLLAAKVVKIENAAAAAQKGEFEAIVESAPGSE